MAAKRAKRVHEDRHRVRIWMERLRALERSCSFTPFAKTVICETNELVNSGNIAEFSYELITDPAGLGVSLTFE